MSDSSKKHHRLLKRQIIKHLSEDSMMILAQPEFGSFIEAINEAYHTFDADYKQLHRSLEISSDELFIVNQNLLKLNEELDRFVYSASHDLKAPLSSTLGLVTLLKMSSPTKEQEEYIYMIEKSIKKLTKVIEDLTDFSRNSRLNLKVKPVNFTHIVDEAIESIKYIENSKNVKFCININQRLTFYSDRLRINILLNNLIANAVNYQDPKKDNQQVKINVDVDKKRALIKIEDNGIGIAKEYQEDVFNMFFRASYDSNGSGLGLYIVKGIIEKLKGKITLDSTLGKGTCFTIELYNLPEDTSIDVLDKLKPYTLED